MYGQCKTGCVVTLINNTLVLLKEQEHKDRIFHALEDDWKRLKELLKEQESERNPVYCLSALRKASEMRR